MQESHCIQNAKQVRDLNVRAKIKNSKRKHVISPPDFGLGKVFLDMIPKAQATTATDR